LAVGTWQLALGTWHLAFSISSALRGGDAQALALSNPAVALFVDKSLSTSQRSKTTQAVLTANC